MVIARRERGGGEGRAKGGAGGGKHLAIGERVRAQVLGDCAAAVVARTARARRVSLLPTKKISFAYGVCCGSDECIRNDVWKNCALPAKERRGNSPLALPVCHVAARLDTKGTKL